MAAGDFTVRNNTADTAVVPNAGTNLDLSWDNQAQGHGGIVAYTNPNLRVGVGVYFVTYSEYFYTADTTNNERIEIQAEIHTVAGGVQGGYGQDYIRKSSGQQECCVSGSMILNVTAANTDIFIRTYRTDNSTSGTVNRVVESGGITILQLDTAHNFGLYTASGSEATSTTVERTLNVNTNDRQDTGFTRAGGVVTLSTAGRYLMTYSIDISMTGTAREDILGRITRNGTTTSVVGSQASCYLRGADGCQDGALTWSGIVDVAANDTFQVRWVCPTSATITMPAGGGSFQMWQIPAVGDECIMEATTGDMNVAGLFTWDTLPHIDIASFTATAGTDNIAVDQSDFCLVFSNTSNSVIATTQRMYPMHQLAVNGSTIPTACAGAYHRNSGGSGKIAVNPITIVFATQGSTIGTYITPLGAGGALAQSSGQLSILSLSSIWTGYIFPPAITDVDTDEILSVGQINVVMTGTNFEAAQGTGKVEFCDNATYAGTKVLQSIDTWSDTSIQFDSSLGVLSEGTIYVYITANSGLRSTPISIQVGLSSYSSRITDLSPDHYWRLNNVYNDTGITGPQRNMTSGVVGTWTFNTNKISDDNTHSLNMNALTNRREIVDSDNMNITITSSERTLCCWIQLNDIQQPLATLWKEGGGVQNLAFMAGQGNVLMAQMADTPSLPGNVQAWSDFKLAINRPYHICMRYSLTETPKEFRLFIDGIEQSNTDGNPMGTGTFNSHSGDVAWGDPDTNLETGGTDIAYNSMDNSQMSDFATWSDNSGGVNAGALDKVTEIRDILYRRGAIPKDIITTGTEGAMQTAINATADVRVDWPLSYRINDVTGGGDLEITLTDKVFAEEVTSHIEWRGAGTLTLVNVGTSNAETAKCWSVTGGTINVINTVNQAFNVKDAAGSNIVGVNVHVYQSSDDTEIMADITDASGNASDGLFRYNTDTSVYFRIRSSNTADGTRYVPVSGSGTITASGFSVNIIMEEDTIVQ